MISYLVDWGNGFIGGYTKDFNQQFNTPEQDLFFSMKCNGISDLRIITPQELDNLRGFHKPNLCEYLRGTSEEMTNT